MTTHLQQARSVKSLSISLKWNATIVESLGINMLNVVLGRGHRFKEKATTEVQRKDRSTVKCFKCDELGHFASACPKGRSRGNDRVIEKRVDICTVAPPSVQPVSPFHFASTLELNAPWLRKASPISLVVKELITL